MKDQGQEVFPIKKDIMFMETYNQILKRLERLKIVELRAVGRAIGNAISLSQKITHEHPVAYLRMTTEQCVIQSRKNVICVIRLKFNGQNKSSNEEKKVQYVEKKGNHNENEGRGKGNQKYRQK